MRAVPGVEWRLNNDGATRRGGQNPVSAERIKCDESCDLPEGELSCFVPDFRALQDRNHALTHVLGKRNGDCDGHNHEKQGGLEQRGQ